MYSYRYTTYYDINRLSLYKYHVPWETVRVLVSLNVQTLVLLNRWPTRIKHNLYHFSLKSIEFILYNTLHTWMNITMTRSKNRAKTPIGILGISIHVWVGSILGKNCLPVLLTFFSSRCLMKRTINMHPFSWYALLLNTMHIRYFKDCHLTVFVKFISSFLIKI